MYTYSSHPAGAAASLKNIEIIEHENLVKNAHDRGEQLKSRLEEIRDKHPIIGDVRGTGLIQGIEFVKDRETKEHFDPAVGLNTRLTEKLIERGVWIRVPAYILPIAPPLVINSDETDELVDAIDESITEVEQDLSV